MSFLDSLMYGRSIANNPQFAAMEKQRMDDERQRQYLMQDVEANKAIYNQLYGDNGTLSGLATMTPDQRALANQQASMMTSLYSPLEDTRKSYATNYGGTINPTDFQREMQFFQDDPENFAKFYAAQNAGKGTKISTPIYMPAINMPSHLRSLEDEMDLKQYEDYRNTASAAEDALRVAEEGMDLLKGSRGNTGAWEPLKAEISKWSGLPLADVTDATMWDQYNKKVALDSLQAFKGPTTDFEFGIVQDMAPSLGDPAEANYLKTRMKQRLALKKIYTPQLYKRWIEEGRPGGTFREWVKPEMDRLVPTMKHNELRSSYVEFMDPKGYQEMLKKPWVQDALKKYPNAYFYFEDGEISMDDGT